MTDFVHWYALRDASAHAPDGPGVFQIRVPEGLLTYPTGRSAMAYYALAHNLRDEIARIAADHDELDFLCRHQSSAEPAVLLEFVRSQFVRRFGTAPNWPESEQPTVVEPK
jgi:hypothetical protein